MDSHRHIEQAAADWIALRSDAGRAWTLGDQAALDAWLAQSTAHQVAFIRLQAVWQRGDRLKALGAGMPRGEVPPPGAWRQSPFFRHRSLEPSTARAETSSVAGPPNFAGLRFKPRARSHAPRRGLRLASTAAGVLLAAVLGYGTWYFGAMDEAAYRTPVGATQTVPLADGSQAVLGSGTDLRVALSPRARMLELQQGEAYFQVAKDAGRPFVVQAGDARVIAVGTRFAVRRDAGALRVVVTEGTVRLEGIHGDAAVPARLFAAGTVARLQDGKLDVQTGVAEQAEQLLGWRRGEVLFSATPLAEAVAEFNRYTPRKLRIQDASLAQMRVDGSFRTDNVDGFVRLLEQAFPVRAERTAEAIVLHRL